MRARGLLALSMILASGCEQAGVARVAPAGVPIAPASRFLKFTSSSKISHVVIVYQENRTPDDLFQGLPHADTQPYGLNSEGKQVNLRPASLTAPYDLDHEHRGFVIEYDNGAMNGFNIEKSSKCTGKSGCPKPYLAAYGYVPHSEVKPYFDMAEQYVFGDRMFQTNQGPSFPAHQYILSGTSSISQGSTTLASENPFTAQQKFTGGCDSPKGSLVVLIDGNGQESQEAYPCFDRPSLTDLVDAKGLTWHYYQSHLGPGLWNGPDAIAHVRSSSEYATDVVAPPSQVLKDVAAGTLANVVWVTPTAKASDHANITDGSGPSWVASVVNAIGESQYWQNTAIIVTWDDWGGWADHVPPQIYNPYELGFRVPLIVISPYAKRAYISHVPHEFGSILKFTEETFGLGSLGTTDVRADDLSDCFDFSQKPRKFRKIPAPLGPAYFLRQPISMESPDDE